MALTTVVVALAVTGASARIISVTDTLTDASEVDFDQGVTTSPVQQGAGGRPTCATQASGVDFSFRTDAVAVCPYCRTYSLSSPRPFHRSVGTFSQQDFGALIDVSDPQAFSRIDTLHDSNDSCYWPSEVRGNDYVGPDSLFYVLRTDSGNAVVVKLAPIEKVAWLGAPGLFKHYFEQIVVTWFLQTDGSLNLSGINQVSITNPAHSPRGPATRTNAPSTVALFDLHGRSVGTVPAHGLAHMPAGVYAMRIPASRAGGTRGFVVVPR